jgi:hypothetical protein
MPKCAIEDERVSSRRRNQVGHHDQRPKNSNQVTGCCQSTEFRPRIVVGQSSARAPGDRRDAVNLPEERHQHRPAPNVLCLSSPYANVPKPANPAPNCSTMILSAVSEQATQ